MTKLEKVAREYADEAAIAAESLEGLPQNTMPGRKMRQRDAQVASERLAAEYRELISAGAFAVFVRGPTRALEEEFAQVAAAEVGSITVPADGLYQRLAEQVEPSIGDRRQFGSAQLWLVAGGLTEVGKELDIWRIKQPQIFDVSIVPPDQLRGVVRDIIRNSDGDRLNAATIARAAVRAALLMGYSKPVLPVVLTGVGSSQECETLGVLLWDRTFQVQIRGPEDVTPEAVVKAFTDIKAKVKQALKR